MNYSWFKAYPDLKIQEVVSIPLNRVILHEHQTKRKKMKKMLFCFNPLKSGHTS